MIILPRQARDKYRESTLQKDAFLQEARTSEFECGHEARVSNLVRKTRLLRHFDTKTAHFTKTGSGHTHRKSTQKRDDAFSCSFNDTESPGLASLTALVDRVKGHPALLGYYVCDGAEQTPFYCELHNI